MTIDCHQLAAEAAKACRPRRNQESAATATSQRSHAQRYSHVFAAQLTYRDNRPSPKGRERTAPGDVSFFCSFPSGSRSATACENCRPAPLLRGPPAAVLGRWVALGLTWTAQPYPRQGEYSADTLTGTGARGLLTTLLGRWPFPARLKQRFGRLRSRQLPGSRRGRVRGSSLPAYDGRRGAD